MGHVDIFAVTRVVYGKSSGKSKWMRSTIVSWGSLRLTPS
jgi:hypothetical protein